MTDLRQGLSLTAHGVLDMLDMNQHHWADHLDYQQQLEHALEAATSARSEGLLLSHKHSFALEAAARLIDAAEEMRRMIELDGDC